MSTFTISTADNLRIAFQFINEHSVCYILLSEFNKTFFMLNQQTYTYCMDFCLISRALSEIYYRKRLFKYIDFSMRCKKRELTFYKHYIHYKWIRIWIQLHQLHLLHTNVTGSQHHHHHHHHHPSTMHRKLYLHLTAQLHFVFVRSPIEHVLKLSRLIQDQATTKTLSWRLPGTMTEVSRISFTKIHGKTPILTVVRRSHIYSLLKYNTNYFIASVTSCARVSIIHQMVQTVNERFVKVSLYVIMSRFVPCLNVHYQEF